MTSSISQEPSEFAGRPGLIQSISDGHLDRTNDEKLFLLKQTDSLDAATPVDDPGIKDAP
jgi:hypothetical protein